MYDASFLQSSVSLYFIRGPGRRAQTCEESMRSHHEPPERRGKLDNADAPEYQEAIVPEMSFKYHTPPTKRKKERKGVFMPVVLRGS